VAEWAATEMGSWAQTGPAFDRGAEQDRDGRERGQWTRWAALVRSLTVTRKPR
jgi:hypothetical protein